MALLTSCGASQQLMPKSIWPLVGSKETSTSLLTKLVPGQMGLSQQLNSKAACLIVRPGVRAQIESVSSVSQSYKQDCQRKRSTDVQLM